LDPFDPSHPVVLGDEDGPGKELVKIDGWRGSGQLTVVDQASSRREQLQADVIGRTADRIKYSGHTATASSVDENRLSHVLRTPVDDVAGPGGANPFYPLAAADT